MTTQTTPQVRPLHLLALSGHDLAPIRRQACEYAERLFDDVSLEDICYSAGVGPVHHPYRVAVVASSRSEAGKRLLSFSTEKSTEGVIVGRGAAKAPKVAFLFTGQGSQYVGMARQLYAQAPVFTAALDDCDRLAKPLLGQSLLELLYENKDESILAQTAVQQPALFAIGYALAELWKSWGVQPDAVLGHSIGEIGAAVTAGMMSLEDGVKLAVTRGKLMQSLPSDGAMQVIFTDATEVAAALGSHAGKVAIAAINGPGLVTISGDQVAVAEIAAHFEAADVQTRALKVSHAFHSPLMETILDDLAEVAATCTPLTGIVPFVSTVTAQVEGQLDADYWRAHASGTVNFDAGVKLLIEQGIGVFLELGPKAVLTKMARRANHDAKALWLPTIDPDRDWDTVLNSLGQMYVGGMDVDWAGFDASYVRQRVAVPTYSVEQQGAGRDEPPTPQGTSSTPVTSPVRPSITSTQPVTQGAHAPVSAPADWFYGLEWRPIPPLAAGATDGTWLIFADAGGVGAALASAMPGAVIAERAATSGPLDANRYGLNLADPNAVSAMLAHFGSRLSNCRGALYLWGLDQAPVLSGDAAVLTLPQGAIGALELTKALVDAKLYTRSDFRLYLVTRNSQPQGDTVVDASQAPIWGLGRCIALEHPELRMCCVDLDASGELGPLLALLQSTTAEDQICLRGDAGFSSRLVAQSRSAAAMNVDDQGTYLVTGGLGGLGLLFAGRLADRGAKHLVLFGRNAPKPAAQEMLASLRNRGVSVEVAAVDVSDPAALNELIGRVASGSHPVKGVIHTAGILDDGVLIQQTGPRFESVMSPKVRGTVNLFNACRSQPLDFMVFCSSVSSLFGAPGQANYAAANAFMDSFASQARVLGVPAVSINWGPWAEVGMAQVHLKRIAARGLPPLASRGALNALEQVCVGDAAQVGVVHLDLVRLAALGPRFRDRPLTLDLLSTGQPPQADQALSIQAAMIAAAPADRGPMLELWLAGQVAQLLGMESEGFDVQKPLTWHGLDSLMAVDLKKVFDDHLDVEVKHQLIQSGPSVRELAEQVVPMIDYNASVNADLSVTLSGATLAASGATFGAVRSLRAGVLNGAISQPAIGEGLMATANAPSEYSKSADSEDEEGVPTAVAAGLVGILGVLTVGAVWYFLA